MESVVIFKNRGAIVSTPTALVWAVPGAVVLPLDLVRGIEVRKFSATINGLPAVEWAKFWLRKGDKRARKYSDHVEIEALVVESKISQRQCRLAFRKAISAANAAKKSQDKAKGKVTGGIVW